MRPVSLALLLFFSLALPALCQEQADSLQPSVTPFALELRGGANGYGGMLTFEARFSPVEFLSIDAGMRPTSRGFYGGLSAYPLYPFFLQLQAGSDRTSGETLIDGPVFESDMYGGFRTGVIIGRNSGLRFSASLGAMMLVDSDYCSDCGFVDPATFVPTYKDEIRWTPTIEFGVGARL